MRKQSIKQCPICGTRGCVSNIYQNDDGWYADMDCYIEETIKCKNCKIFSTFQDNRLSHVNFDIENDGKLFACGYIFTQDNRYADVCIFQLSQNIAYNQEHQDFGGDIRKIKKHARRIVNMLNFS